MRKRRAFHDDNANGEKYRYSRNGAQVLLDESKENDAMAGERERERNV